VFGYVYTHGIGIQQQNLPRWAADVLQDARERAWTSWRPIEACDDGEMSARRMQSKL
jgi:hypothetical protein